jgi:hypothetical protein
MTGSAPSTIMTPSMPGRDAKLQIVLKDIHARWRRLSDADLSAIRSRDELIARVTAKYGQENPYLQCEVDVLLDGRKI